MILDMAIGSSAESNFDRGREVPARKEGKDAGHIVDWLADNDGLYDGLVCLLLAI